MSKTTAIISILTVSAIAATSAQAAMKQNDSNRPVAAIAADLGITADQFMTCFNDVNPAAKGTKASGAREHANKNILLPCLQKANASITNDSLDAVMDKYRPEGRVTGN